MDRHLTREHGKDFAESQVIPADDTRKSLYDGRTMKSTCFVQYRIKGESMLHTRYFDMAREAYEFIDANNIWEKRDEKGNILRPHQSKWSWMGISHIWLRQAIQG